MGQSQYSFQGRAGTDLCRRLCLRAWLGAECKRNRGNACDGHVFQCKAYPDVCPSACAHHSRIIRNLLGELAEKNLRFSEKLTHMGQRTTRAKLMSYLSAEAQRRGEYEFDIPFSRQQLADYLGVERSGLSLELGKMRAEGLLDFQKNHFVLKV